MNAIDEASRAANGSTDVARQTHANQSTSIFDIVQRTRGRAVYVHTDGTLYLSRGYTLFASNDDGSSWQRVTSMPASLVRGMGRFSRMAARLLRFEVKALAELSDGALVASNREWVYFGRPGEAMMRRAVVAADDQPLAPPMTLTVGPNDRVIWGEYNSQTAHGLPVRLFVSDDGGKSYKVAHVFEGGSILHIHNLIYDAPRDAYWVLAGDHHHEPGIGRLSGDLQEFEWVQKGDQIYRAVDAFDFGDCLIYGMDSERAENAVMRFDKETGKVERLQPLDGSCIYSCTFGGVYALTTSIEPSKVNKATAAGLWLSRDGLRWERVFAAEKDRWNAIYFQFGSIVLPRGRGPRETVFFSGQALCGVDGRAMVGRWGDVSSDRPTEAVA